MRRGGGDAGDNPRGKHGVQFNMPVPKFLQQLKDSVQSEISKKTKEFEDRLNQEENFDIQNAVVIREKEEKAEEKEIVDMNTFKPKYVSKGDRNGLGALKEEIENKKKEELKKKQLQLKKLTEDQDGKHKNDSKDNKEKGNEKDPKKSNENNLLNQKRRSIEEAMKNLEKETTQKKKVKQNLLSFNDDDDEDDD